MGRKVGPVHLTADGENSVLTKVTELRCSPGLHGYSGPREKRLGSAA